MTTRRLAVMIADERRRAVHPHHRDAQITNPRSDPRILKLWDLTNRRPEQGGDLGGVIGKPAAPLRRMAASPTAT